MSGVTVYFLENQEYYEKRANVYGYSDDATRWALLSRGVLEFLKLKIFVPDIIHCNDWHTGAVVNYLKTVYRTDKDLQDIASVFTIHNLHFQGNFDHKYVSELDYDDGKSPIASMLMARITKLNFMRRGILYADVVNTVSKTYAREILTPEYGEGLDKLLLEVREKLFGIINGLDYSEFDPSKDTLIEHNFDSTSLSLRKYNKIALQKEFNLPVDPEILTLGFVGRLDMMKGVDLMIKVMEHVLDNYPVQFVQVGGGDGQLIDAIKALKNKYPTKVAIHPYPNFTLPRLIFAGSDAIIYPSRFEPCGIVQIEAMRYGCIPIVRKVGGLADTVENFNSKAKTGNGFVFDTFDEFALYGEIVRAIELYTNKTLWKKLQINAMKSDYSWEFSAKEYEKLYSRALLFKNKRYKKPKSIEAAID